MVKIISVDPQLLHLLSISIPMLIFFTRWNQLCLILFHHVGHPYVLYSHQNRKCEPISVDCMEYLDTRLKSDWNKLSINSLSKALKEHEIALIQTNLRMKVHLDINIEWCNVVKTRMSPYFDEINHVSLQHITLTAMIVILSNTYAIVCYSFQSIFKTVPTLNHLSMAFSKHKVWNSSSWRIMKEQ